MSERLSLHRQSAVKPTRRNLCRTKEKAATENGINRVFSTELTFIPGAACPQPKNCIKKTGRKTRNYNN